MDKSWKQFLLIRLPTAVIVIMLLVQIAALALSHVTLRRQESDIIPLAVARDRGYHRILLFGDSITRNATRDYNVGPASDVLNLSTHVLFGLHGDALTTRIYLETHAPPEYVVIAGTPNLYDSKQDIAKIHYYTWNVFKRPDERAFLKQLYPDIDAQDWMPAIMSLQQEVVEPLLSLAALSPPTFEPVGKDPNPNAPLEPASTNAAMPDEIKEHIDASTTLLPPQAGSLHELCNLSGRYGFKILFVWPPSPKPVVDHWRAVGAMGHLDDDIRAALGPGCPAPTFTDLNDKTAYTVFDHVAYHLRGDGWEQHFTSQLKSYLQSLPDTRSPAAGAAAAPTVQ